MIERYDVMQIFDFDDMPAAKDAPEGMRVIKSKDEEWLIPPFRFDDNAADRVEVVYTTRPEGELHMLIYMPKNAVGTYPLAVVVPGSGWHKQTLADNSRYNEMLVKEGFVVAAIEYRPSSTTVLPGQIHDIKAGIKFLVKNAAKYHVDVNRIGIMGDSSGGHTALMVGMTGMRDFNDDEFDGISFDIKCIIDFFGPTRFTTMNDYPIAEDHICETGCVGEVMGGIHVMDNVELAEKLSPINYIYDDMRTPPIMMVHGNCDGVICFHQSVEMYEALRAKDRYAELVCVDHGRHWSHGFRSMDVLREVRDFLVKYLG